MAQEGVLNKSLVATGAILMFGKDSADARDLALKEALRNAVEQALGWLLPTERIVRYYPAVQDHILSEPMAYVQDYQIIHEDATSGLYQVTVQTTLYIQGLRRDLQRLGLFLAANDRPRVVVFVAEGRGQQDSWHWWWQVPNPEYQRYAFSETFLEFLSAGGLVPLNPEEISGKIPENPDYQKPLLTDAEGAALAQELDAEIVVLGQVTYQPSTARTPAMSRGFLRVLRADSGRLITQMSVSVATEPTGGEPVPEQSLTKLADKMAPQLVQEMLTPFITASEAPREITVEVHGLRRFVDFVFLKEFVQQAPGVKEVKQMQLMPGSGSFTLILAGNLDEFGKAFTSHDFGSFATLIDLNADNLVTLNIINQR
jgi:hypothetical protein